MITYITDIQKDEPDILKGLEYSDLIILDCNDEFLQLFSPPRNGWTTEALFATNDKLEEKNDIIMDGYLGKQWVGGSEV